MTRPLTLRIAIADGEHARFVQPDANYVLRTVSSIELGVRPPSFAGPGFRPAWSLVRKRQPRASCCRRAARLAQDGEGHVRAIVAEQLNAASARDEFDELLLVAPPRALHELREALDPATKAKLVGTLERDLVKTPDHELSPHVREWVSPEHRPSA